MFSFMQLDLSDERITDANGNVTGYDYGEDVNNDTDNLVSYGLNGVEAKYAEGNIGGYIHGTHNIHTFKAEFETVGCAVVDSLGNCAAATSTGGLINKMCGRIGKRPIPNVVVIHLKPQTLLYSLYLFFSFY